MDINNKHILVTGAASGIGLGIVKHCLAAGAARVVMVDIDESLADIAKALDAKPDQIDCSVLDISNAKAVESLSYEFDRLDMVVNCAGVSGPFGPVWEVPIEQVRWTIDTNLMGTVNVAHAFLPILERNGENDKYFIVVSSHLGVATSAHLFAYQMSKHAIVAFAEALQHDLEIVDSSVQVAVYFPYFVQSNIAKSERHLKRQNKSLYVAEQSQAFFTEISQATDDGMTPQTSAALLFSKLQAGEFYIFADQRSQQAFEERAERILRADAYE